MAADAAAPDAVPMWIPTPDGNVFGWFHAPAPAVARRCGVLMCDPFGWNRMALHLTYRHLALRLAAAGFPVLRTDHPGTCDSEGVARHTVRIHKWLRSLEVAGDRLKEWSGVTELAVFGVLLGGTLGVLLSERRKDIATLVLWEPYPTGRAWIRAGLAATATVDSNPKGLLPSTARDGDREVLGFLLTREMSDEVAGIDLRRSVPQGLRSVLLLPKTDADSESVLALHLTSLGIKVDEASTGDESLDDVLLSIGTGYPARTIADIVNWMVAEHPPADRGGRLAGSICLPEVTFRSDGVYVRESAAFLGPDKALFGIVAEPAGMDPGPIAVLLVSAGGNHRPGINRNYTEWARTLAARGHRVLRVDLRGIGDSPEHARPGTGLGRGSDLRAKVHGLLYRADAHADVAEAVSWLYRLGAAHVVCVGLCAGGYQAMRAALTGANVGSIVMLNPLRFHDDRGEQSGSDLLLVNRLLRAVRGRAGVRGWARRTLAAARDATRRFSPGLLRRASSSHPIARSLLELAEGGIDVLVVYNDNEPMRQVLQEAIQPVLGQLEGTGRFRLVTVGHADHIFSPLWVQEAVGKIVMEQVERIAREGFQPKVDRGGISSADPDRVLPG